MFIIVFNQIFQGTKPFYTTLFTEEEEKEKIMQQQATNKKKKKKKLLSFSSQRIEILVCFLCV